MKIRSKTLHIVFTHDVVVGNGAIEATLEHIAFISEDKGKVHLDLDFSDVNNVKFMGIPIENGYTGYEKFKKSMLALGIDVVKLFDDKAAELITDEDIDKLKQMYGQTVGFQNQRTYICYEK